MPFVVASDSVALAERAEQLGLLDDEAVGRVRAAVRAATGEGTA